MTRTIQRWSDQSDSALRDCFSTTTEWDVFKDDNLNTNTDWVICYIGKCIDDVVPRITVRTFPNEKPWVNGKFEPTLRNGLLLTTQVIWKNTASPGMRSGELLTVLRNNTGTELSPTLRAPTQDTCGPDSEQ